MSLRIRTRSLAVAAVLVAATLSGVTLAARGTAAPTLRPLAAGTLVASVLRSLSAPGPVSGELRARVDLGLPSVPAGAPAPDDPVLRALDAVNGDHRVRVWRSEDGLRIAELLPAAELGLFVSRTGRGAEAWLWDSQTFTAHRLGPVGPGPARLEHPAELFDPVELSRLSLHALSPTTRVFVGSSASVAGRAAYRLVLEPRQARTLVGRVEIDVDAARRVPLGVAVFARGAGSPGLSVAFHSVSFSPIGPATFRFTPPPGATVRTVAPGPYRAPAMAGPLHASGRDGHGERLDRYVRVFGEGWETVVAYRLQGPLASGGGLDLRSLLPFSGALFSARLAHRADHAWLMVGAVPQSRLAEVERELP